jgi:hypothetical protein
VLSPAIIFSSSSILRFKSSSLSLSPSSKSRSELNASIISSSSFSIGC